MNLKVIDFSLGYIPSRDKYSKSWDNLFKAKKTFKIIIVVGNAGHYQYWARKKELSWKYLLKYIDCFFLTHANSCL